MLPVMELILATGTGACTEVDGPAVQVIINVFAAERVNTT